MEIHRITGLSYKSALFLMNRIRAAMATTPTEPLKGDVEVDELFVGGRTRKINNERSKTIPNPKTPVIGLVERGGRVRPMVVPNVTGKTLKAAIHASVDQGARILTDEWSGYRGIGKSFKRGHETVRHSTNEYVRGDVHTNTIEGFFGIVRRGLDGIYHSVSRRHLHRYLSEFEFRYNNRELGDGERTMLAVRQAEGKRLAYKDVTGRVE